jgi:hypothetical protein
MAYKEILFRVDNSVIEFLKRFSDKRGDIYTLAVPFEIKDNNILFHERKDKQKVIHYCVCTICGIRNDKDNPESTCRNGHDSWLEYRDVEVVRYVNEIQIMAFSNEAYEPFKTAMIATGYTKQRLFNHFMDTTIKQFTIVKPLQI